VTLKNSVFWNVAPCGSCKKPTFRRECVASIFRVEEITRARKSVRVLKLEEQHCVKKPKLDPPPCQSNPSKISLIISLKSILILKQKKLNGLSPQANYTDRATAACRRSDCQLLRIEGATWSA
jgi:hypothetical protein